MVTVCMQLPRFLNKMCIDANLLFPQMISGTAPTQNGSGAIASAEGVSEENLESFDLFAKNNAFELPRIIFFKNSEEKK